MNNKKQMRGIPGLRVLTSAALVVFLGGCGSNPGTPAASPAAVDTVLTLPNLEGQTVVINTYGGDYAATIQKDVVEPFEAATGAKVELSTKCCESFTAQVKGGQFAGDVVLGTDYGVMMAWGKEGLFKDEPRLAQIAKARDLDPADYNNDQIATGAYAKVLAWNTTYADDHPTSWSEFFDTAKYKGTRALQGNPPGQIEAARLGAGTSASSLYPVDVDKAMATLTTVRDQAPTQFYSSGAEQINMLATGEAAYGFAWSSRVATGMKKGLPLDFTFNQALYEASAAAIPATAKNVDGAVAFLDFYMQPKVQAAFATDFGGSPIVPAALQFVDPAQRQHMVTEPANLKKVIRINDDWWLENTQSAYATYTKWKTGS